MLESQTVNGGIPPQAERPELLLVVAFEQFRDGPSHRFGPGDAFPVAEALQCVQLCVRQFDNCPHERHREAEYPVLSKGSRWPGCFEPEGLGRAYDRLMDVQFTAVFQKVPEGYIAFVEELPGANTQGATLDEARANLHEAVDLVLQANRELIESAAAGSELIREPFRVSA